MNINFILQYKLKCMSKRRQSRNEQHLISRQVRKIAEESLLVFNFWPAVVPPLKFSNKLNLKNKFKYFYLFWMTRWKKSDLLAQKVYFYTYVLVTMANLPEFCGQRRLDDVLTTWRMPRRFMWENYTSGRRPISLSMLKVPIVYSSYFEYWRSGS